MGEAGSRSTGPNDAMPDRGQFAQPGLGASGRTSTVSRSVASGDRRRKARLLAHVVRARADHADELRAAGFDRTVEPSIGVTVLARSTHLPQPRRMADPAPRVQQLEPIQRLRRVDAVRDRRLAVVGKHLHHRSIEQHAHRHLAVAPPDGPAVTARIVLVERGRAGTLTIDEQFERLAIDADDQFLAGRVEQTNPGLRPVTARNIDHDLGRSGQRPALFFTATGPLSRRSVSSWTGVWTRRIPSGRRRNESCRGTDCAPRQISVGSSFAYSQLLIQAIQIRRPSDGGISEKDSGRVEVLAVVDPQRRARAGCRWRTSCRRMCRRSTDRPSRRRCRPGLMSTSSTHRVFAGSPSTASGNRSGHSHTPPVAPAGPKSLSVSHFFRSGEPKKRTLCWSARTVTMIQRRVGSCQKTLGSRNSFSPRSSDGVARDTSSRCGRGRCCRRGSASACRGRVRCRSRPGTSGRRRSGRQRPLELFAIDDGAAREDHDAVLLAQRDGQVLPVQEVAAHGVSPAHVAPLGPDGLCW